MFLINILDYIKVENKLLLLVSKINHPFSNTVSCERLYFTQAFSFTA